MATTPSVAQLPSLDNWTDRKIAMVVTGTLLMLLSTWIVGLRLWIRYSRKGSALGMDDAFIAVGWVFGIVFTVGAIYTTADLGFDRHIWESPYTIWAKSGMWGWLLELFYMITTSATKFSILLFYRRLGSGSYSSKNMYPVWAALAYTALYAVVFIIIAFLSCVPFGTYWQRYDPSFTGKYTCMNFKISAPASGAFSTFGDFIAVLIPWVMLSDLQVPLRQKIALYMIFAVGLLVVGAGIARTVFINELAAGKLDLSWIAYNLFHTANVEVHLALICASAPSLRALFANFFRNTMNKLSRPTGSKLSSAASWSAGGRKRSHDALGDGSNNTIGSKGGFNPFNKFRMHSDVTEITSQQSRTTNGGVSLPSMRLDSTLSRKTSKSSYHSRQHSRPPNPADLNIYPTTTNTTGQLGDPGLSCPNAAAGQMAFITAPTFLETGDSSEEEERLQPSLSVIREDSGSPCACCGMHHDAASYLSQAHLMQPYDPDFRATSPNGSRSWYPSQVGGQSVNAIGFPTPPPEARRQTGPRRGYGYSAHVSAGPRDPSQPHAV
ncbi:hypothetical protein P152DRAFT_470882 [Eremomyces bilateralis CBS 781.70]|uniref:Rhodopsin domain-containing protein n=1 Tax=Eremomyces bilateralis CBS 781.70 TaxID=1392243 RepID=A0A6G1GBH4_9PEZI|nr:uncharacterized protein P152DRAFT_470882 [Eremomyces bilateralis CBS 781.70]KAF1815448.1 hypothetical protein P152DRAFT_470882 [Eremomyces bilateralis CBS 781.70]